MFLSQSLELCCVKVISRLTLYELHCRDTADPLTAGNKRGLTKEALILKQVSANILTQPSWAFPVI